MPELPWRRTDFPGRRGLAGSLFRTASRSAPIRRSIAAPWATRSSGRKRGSAISCAARQTPRLGAAALFWRGRRYPLVRGLTTASPPPVLEEALPRIGISARARACGRGGSPVYPLSISRSALFLNLMERTRRIRARIWECRTKKVQWLSTRWNMAGHRTRLNYHVLIGGHECHSIAEAYGIKAWWGSSLLPRWAPWPAAWCYSAPRRMPGRNRPLATHVETLSQWRRPPRKLQWSGPDRRKRPTISPTSSTRAMRCPRRRLWLINKIADRCLVSISTVTPLARRSP